MRAPLRFEPMFYLLWGTHNYMATAFSGGCGGNRFSHALVPTHSVTPSGIDIPDDLLCDGSLAEPAGGGDVGGGGLGYVFGYEAVDLGTGV